MYFEEASNFQILLWGSGERALICPAEQAQNSEHMHLMACGGLFTFVLPAPPPLQPRSPMWLMIQTINDPCLCLFFLNLIVTLGTPLSLKSFKSTDEQVICTHFFFPCVVSWFFFSCHPPGFLVLSAGSDSGCPSSLHACRQVKQPPSMRQWHCLGPTLILPHLYCR